MFDQSSVLTLRDMYTGEGGESWTGFNCLDNRKKYHFFIEAVYMPRYFHTPPPRLFYDTYFLQKNPLFSCDQIFYQTSVCFVIQYIKKIQ